MDAKRISLTISEVCQSLGISYKSDNPAYVAMLNDARRLCSIMRELRIIAGDLEAISDRQGIKELKTFLHREAISIDKIDHDLVRMARQLKNE